MGGSHTVFHLCPSLMQVVLLVMVDASRCVSPVDCAIVIYVHAMVVTPWHPIRRPVLHKVHWLLCTLVCYYSQAQSAKADTELHIYIISFHDVDIYVQFCIRFRTLCLCVLLANNQDIICFITIADTLTSLVQKQSCCFEYYCLITMLVD